MFRIAPITAPSIAVMDSQSLTIHGLQSSLFRTWSSRARWLPKTL